MTPPPRAKQVIAAELCQAADGRKQYCVADCCCEQSRKRAISSHGESVSPPKHKFEIFGVLTTKKQKMESEVDGQSNYIADYPSKETRVEAGDVMPCPLSAIPPCQQNQDANDEAENGELNKNCSEIRGSSLLPVPLTIVEEAALNRTCYGTSMLSFDSPIRSLIEAREIVVSNEANETHMETPAVALPATLNETVAESVTIGMATVESVEPHGCPTEYLEPESIPFSKENEIIASESVVDVVQEHAGASLCPVETEGENALSNNIASVHETENTIVSNMGNTSAENCEELAGQSPLPSPPSSSEEIIGSSNLHSGNLHTQQPVIVNENLNPGHSNDSSHPSILYPSPPLETAGISNSQRPVLTESYVSDFQSSATLLPERSPTEENNTGSSSGSPGIQILPITSIIHPLALHPDPLQNELTRIQKNIETRTKVHQEKQLKIKLECEQELEKVRKKYDALLEEDESGFDKDRKNLETMYSKLAMHQKLAELFRCQIMGMERPESSGGRPVGPTLQFYDHQVQMTQASPTALGPTPQFHHQVHMTWASPTASGPATPQFHHQMHMTQALPTALGPPVPQFHHQMHMTQALPTALGPPAPQFHHQMHMTQALPTALGPPAPQFHHQMHRTQAHPTVVGPPALRPPAPHLLYRLSPPSTLPSDVSPTMIKHNFPGSHNPGT